ncbi:MAG: type II toxin-antitoxin system RelB/DinJ family antitoxin [bacterium]
MSKSEMIRAWVEPELKHDVDKILKNLGISVSQAISLFYTQVKIKRGLPFNVKIPNKTTRKTFENTDKGIGIKTFKNKEDLFKDIGLH